MKRVFKSSPPNELTIFEAANPTANWDPDFRDYATPPFNAGHDYKALKKRIIIDQGGLCAYCEKNIGDGGVYLQKIEHYHPKSDKSTPGVNWGLQWSNVIAVCTGGEHDDRSLHPLPANLSCDSHKNHWLDKKKTAAVTLLAMLSSLQSPLAIDAFPNFFDFSKADGKLVPNGVACNAYDTSIGAMPGTTLKRLWETILALNLNCDRLCTERRLVLTQYNQEVARARKAGDVDFKSKVVQKWFGKRWPSFFTTRRSLLGKEAEDYLQEVNYAG
jgi:uncharacterized protein (TIGR02646 family)